MGNSRKFWADEYIFIRRANDSADEYAQYDYTNTGVEAIENEEISGVQCRYP